MSKVLVSDKYLTNIANAIRNKNGQNIQYKPSEMANEILAINIGSETKIVDSIIDGSITEVTSNVTYVKEYAFYNDDALVSATLPNATILGNYSFQGCKSLKNITASKVTDICANCFKGCTNLSSISFPNATFADEYAFQNCKTLTSVSLPSLIEIYDYCFASCSNLTSMDLPLVAHISQYCFRNCTKLAEVNLPNVTELYTNCFEGCTGLEKIMLPKTTYIDSGVFSGCSNLQAIVLSNTDEICWLEKANLPDNDNLYIYVPKALLEDYKTAINWEQYADHIRAIEDYPDIIDGELPDTEEPATDNGPDKQEDITFNGSTSMEFSPWENKESQYLNTILNQMKANTSGDNFFYYETTVTNLMDDIQNTNYSIDISILNADDNNGMVFNINKVAHKYTFTMSALKNGSTSKIASTSKTANTENTKKSFTIGVKIARSSYNDYVINLYSNIVPNSDNHITYDNHSSSSFDFSENSKLIISAKDTTDSSVQYPDRKDVKLDFNFGTASYIFDVR